MFNRVNDFRQSWFGLRFEYNSKYLMMLLLISFFIGWFGWGCIKVLWSVIDDLAGVARQIRNRVVLTLPILTVVIYLRLQERTSTVFQTISHSGKIQNDVQRKNTY